MKLETTRQHHMFVNVINELRKETGHEKDFIDSMMFHELKCIWYASYNRGEAKAWIKVKLGW